MNRFMLVLTTSHSLDSKAFRRGHRVSADGRTRVYFAEDARTLLKSGNRDQTETGSWYTVVGDHQYQYRP